MSTDIALRCADKTDIPAIVALLRDDALGRTREASPDAPLYRTAFDAMAQNLDNRLYVLDDDGAIIGCAQLTIIHGLSRKGTTRAIIEGVRIAQSRRGAGLGEGLIRELIGLAGARGCNLIQLTSDKTRRDAHRFYERLGFENSHEGFKMILA